MERRLERILRSKLRAVGREYESARRAYREGRTESEAADDVTGDDETHGDGRAAEHAAGSLPRDDEGRVRQVCRRHAERRAVSVDATGTPACFDADHPDCRGCVEDVREGSVETW